MSVQPIETAEERAAETEATIAGVAAFIRDRDASVRAVYPIAETDNGKLQWRSTPWTFMYGGVDVAAMLYAAVAHVVENTLRAAHAREMP